MKSIVYGAIIFLLLIHTKHMNALKNDNQKIPNNYAQFEQINKCIGILNELSPASIIKLGKSFPNILLKLFESGSPELLSKLFEIISSKQRKPKDKPAEGMLFRKSSSPEIVGSYQKNVTDNQLALYDELIKFLNFVYESLEGSSFTNVMTDFINTIIENQTDCKSNPIVGGSIYNSHLSNLNPNLRKIKMPDLITVLLNLGNKGLDITGLIKSTTRVFKQLAETKFEINQDVKAFLDPFQPGKTTQQNSFKTILNDSKNYLNNFNMWLMSGRINFLNNPIPNLYQPFFPGFGIFTGMTDALSLLNFSVSLAVMLLNFLVSSNSPLMNILVTILYNIESPKHIVPRSIKENSYLN